MKFIFPSEVTWKFYLYLITQKSPSCTTRENNFHWNFRVTLHWKKQAFFLIGLLIYKPVFRKTITDRSKNLGQKYARSANWNCFLFNRLDERETPYTIKFTKIYQESFLFSKWTKWNTIICETSTKMELFKSNRSFCNFYPNLPKTSFVHKMSKSKAYTWNEHLLNNRNGNMQVKSTIL